MRPSPSEPERRAGTFSVEQLELKGFSRSLAELQWLLVALVILYYVAPNAHIREPGLFVGATTLYAATVLAHRYSGLFQSETRWKLACETWLMVAFITWLLWQTGNIDSPLLNLYLLVLIMSGLTLGKKTTILQLMLIVAICIQIDFRSLGEISFSTSTLSGLMTKFTPFVLTTYLVTLLAADIRFSRTALQEASETDELTGLPNRRAFLETLRREYERAVRHERTFSLLMIDADGLKPTNDHHGHPIGDRLISQIASTLRTTLRGTDACGRYGGDEFIVLLCDTPAGRALEAAERIRNAVRNTSFDAGGQRIASTVSIGVATYPADARDLDDVVIAADRALYRAKEQGKDRVVGAAQALHRVADANVATPAPREASGPLLRTA
jgi:diguanylate cyclase (GGDEF)-like protein